MRPSLGGAAWRWPREIAASSDRGSNRTILALVLAWGLAMSGCATGLQRNVTGLQPNVETQALYWDDGTPAASEAYALALTNAACDSDLLTWYLSIGWPISRDPVPGQYHEIVFVQDTLGLWSNASVGEWKALERLPDNAQQTPLMTLEGHAVWISPEDPPSSIYLPTNEGVESWPRLDGACA